MGALSLTPRARLVAPAPVTASAPTPSSLALGSPHPDGSLPAELSLLRSARAALEGGDASGALTLLDSYARSYPHGTLQEEMLASRVLALCALGRVEEARGSARRLELIAPRSLHLAQVRASCVAHDP
jgi:hypothetical protein